MSEERSCKNDLTQVEAYLRALSLASVPEEKKQWYIRWVERFVAFLGDKMLEVADREDAENFIASLGRRPGTEPWQIRQATDAVRILLTSIYGKQWLPRDTGPYGDDSEEALDLLRTICRSRHYSPRTERAYAHWVQRFILTQDGARHESIAVSVFDLPQEQPVRRGGRARLRPVPQGEQFPHPFGRIFTLSDVHQGSDDIAYHVPQEAVADDGDVEKGRELLGELRPEHGAHGRPGGAALAAEGGEIVLPHGVGKPFPDRAQVEGLLDVPCVPGKKGGGDGIKEEEVPVLLLLRMTPCVE